MSALDWVLVVASVGAAVAVSLSNSSAARLLRRRVRGARTCKIDQLVEGTIGCIVGKVRADPIRLTAPLSGRPCLCYLVEVEENVTSDSRGVWTTVISEQRGVPFVLEDPTGHVLVDATGAELALEVTTTTASIYDHPNDRRADFVERHRHAMTEIGTRATRLRYHEAIINDGDTIAVLGGAIREPDPDAASFPYRGDQPTRLRMVSTASHPLVIGSKRVLPRKR